MKKIALLFLPLFLVTLLVFGTYSLFEKDIETWVLSEISAFSERHLPVTISAHSFALQAITPAVKVFDVEIKAKNPEALGFSLIKVKEIRANLDFLEALGGKIYLSSLVVDTPSVDINLDPFIKDNANHSEPEEINWNPVFDMLKKLPIFRLAVIRSQVHLASSKLKLDLKLNDLDLIAFNQKTKLNLKLDLANSFVQYGNLVKVPFGLRGDLTLTAKTLEISELDLAAAHNEIHLEGLANQIQTLFKDPQGQFKFSGEISLARLKELFPKESPLPAMSGSVRLNGEAELSPGFRLKSNLNLNGREIKIDQFAVGDLELKGSIKDRTLHLSDLLIHHPSGDLEIKNLESEFEALNKISLKAHLESEQIDAHDLLFYLGVGDIPFELFVAGKFDCAGPLLPKPEVTCRGNAQGDQLEVRSGDHQRDVIAQIESFSAQGEVTINSQAVSYQSQVKLFEDSGTSDGVISYKDGFRINYQSPRLHFRNIKNLANLKLEGSGSVSGQTNGDSDHGLFTIKMDLTDTFFEDYFLGNPKGLLRYEKGKLFFDDVNGQLGATKYSAKVSVDLLAGKISAEAQAPALEVVDVLHAVARKATLPVEFTGFGSAFIRLSGPLQFNQLSYNLSAQTFRGQIAGETYDRLQADINSVDGEVRADKFLLLKNKSKISAQAAGHPNGQIEVTLHGENFRLEESENVSKLSPAISGALNFQMGLKGHVLKPDVSFTGNLSDLVIEEEEFPNSSLVFTANAKGLEGSASLLGHRLTSDFTFPLSDSDPFHLKVNANEWNYATLFALIGGASLLSDYQTTLTGSLDLSAETGGILKSTGRGHIDKFLLKRGSLALSNPQAMEFVVKSGVASLSNFKVTGENSFVELKGNQFTAEDLRVSLDGNANLRLFHIFVPFMEEFGGLGKISARVSGPLTKPEILGSASAQNALVKVKGFPHPFERIETELQFSVSKILVNKITGNLAGGAFSGDGQINIEGPRDLPTTLTAHLDNGNFNVPEGIKTLGDADVAISGNWFPFLLSGTYRVKSGIIEKEFSNDDASGGLKQSSYLPKVILQGAFEPLLLDMQIQLDKGINIKNSLMEGVLSGQIQVKGPPTHPSLLGKITTEKNTKLLFRDKLFEVSTGNIQFRDPNEINPDLYLSARSRVTDYDISLLVQGNAKNPQLHLTSVPPLNEPDIVSLLALGVVTAKADQKFQNINLNDESTTTAALGSAIISSKLVKGVKDSLGVEIQVSSRYDDTKNVSVQKLSFSKKISDRVTVSASRAQGFQNSYEYKLQYNFNNQVSAVTSYEQKLPPEDVRTPEALRKSENILGLDLEYKREFKW